MKYIFRILAVSVFLFVAGRLSAQISVDAPGVVGINEQFNVTFTLHEKASDFEWTPGDNFQLVWGPQTGSSTSISIINGKTTRDSRYTYTYVLLPKSNGSFSLPAAHAVIEKEDVYSKTLNIEVVSDGGSSAAVQPGSSSQYGGDSQDGQSSESLSYGDIFMRLKLNRTKVVAGEPINATLKLYVRGNVAGFEDARFPAFNGFWAQEVEAPQNIQFVRENVGDKIYNTAVLRRWVLIPQKTGKINIDPAELVCLMQQRISTGGSIFDGFFDDYQTVRKRVLSEAAVVNVNALPAGAPASFTGAVGEFKIDASMKSTELKMHDAASLTLTVSGKGNVALVGAPKIKFPPDSEVYDVKTSDVLTPGSGGTSGRKVFEYPFIPRSHGDFEIPAIEFTYYDITSRKYVTLHTQPIAYHVEKTEGADYVSPEGVSVPVSRQKDVKNLGEDIHYINTKLPELRSESNFFIGTGMFWMLTALIVMLTAAIVAVVSRVRERRSDVVSVRTRGASKMARKRLASAKSYLAKNLYSAFYEELHKALLGYVSDKLNIGMADLSKDSITSALTSAGVKDGLVSEYVALLDSCEFARYAPAGGSSVMQESYDKAVDVISAIDDNMKRRVSKPAATAAALLLLALPGVAAQAQTNEYVDSLWNAGVQAYAAGDYASARGSFQAVENLSLTGVELYVNIADACYKEGDIPSAVLYYERALKLDPSDKDARYNLEVARQQVQDRIEVVPEFFVKTWNRKLCYSLSSNVWTLLFFIFLTLGCVMSAVFFLSRSQAWRKTAFFAAIAAFLLCVPCAVDAAWQKKDFQSRDSAVIFAPVCSAKSAPSGTNDLFVLHEGTKVRVLDVVGDWTNIMLADGREGWIQSSNLVII